ncbi:hypothetical protein SAMN05877753_107148 [Bacillus oleivorans]|uniref:Flagellar hook-length control protein FliK n=1 Tax=Bacillus oleivorans TaxID=1448271 RepID=A0A285D1Q9_9BACI|nr:hypothetical protein [Bacillus oleivorans]SNX73605.1 hypothetical protein SAMN05877753_107148 [Bacillus oleivorans]
MNTTSIPGLGSISNHTPLRTGDLIQAKLVQTGKDGKAVIVINGETIEAKLLTPLEAGKMYLFQIETSKNEIILKPVQTTASNEQILKAEIISQLMKQLGIQKGSWEQRLVRLAVEDEWLGQGGEKLAAALDWLAKSSMKKQDFQVIEFMSRTNLPFTKPVFQSLSALFSEKDITTLLRSFSIVSNYQPETIQKLITPLETKIGYRIAEQAISPLMKHHETAKQLLTQFMQSFAGSDTLQPKLSVSQAGTTVSIPAALNQSFQTAPVQGPQEILINNLISKGNLSEAGVNTAEEKIFRIEAISFTAVENIERLLKQEMKLQSDAPILPSLGKYALTVIADNRGQLFNQPLATQEELLQFIRLEIAAEIKAGIKALGMNLEAELAKQRTEGLESLKTTLLQLMQQDHVPQKQPIQELLSHLQGQKLVSSEMGPIIHLYTKLPFPLLNQLKDAEISWNGRRTKDGKIDSSHCRVLFHLHLEELGETILDFQVQNRISTLNVFHRMEQFVPPNDETIDGFKLGMKQLGFHLSSLQFQYVSEEEKNKLTPLYQTVQPQTKVDIRV